MGAEVFMVNTSKDCGEYVGSAFNLMRFIVTVGWSIYPLGYYFGYLVGAVDDNVLNFIYNFADMLNKIWLPRHLEGSQGRDSGQGWRSPRLNDGRFEGLAFAVFTLADEFCADLCTGLFCFAIYIAHIFQLLLHCPLT